MTTQTQAAFTGKTTAFGVIGFSALLLAFALAKEFGLIDSGLAKRAVGVIIGAVLIVTGNALPKIVQPLSVRRRNPAGARVAERFAGWTFVLTGIVYSVSWLFVPLDHVMLISSLVGLIAFLLVAASWVWLACGRQPQERSETLTSGEASDMSQTASSSRGVVFLVLHAIFWVFAMFLADSLWGDGVAQWMGVAFVIANGVLITWMAAKNSTRES